MKIHIEIPKEYHQKLHYLKRKEGRSLNVLVNRAIEVFLKLKRVYSK